MKVCRICRSRHEDSVTCAQNGLATDDRHETPSDLVPGFRLVTLLESGQCSELHRAVESSSGRSCLIRIISTDESGSRQLLREAKLAGGVFHPSIAGFYEAGQLDDGSCFLVSEELDGRSLRDVLDNAGTPGLLDTIEILRQISEALHAYHLAGLIHGAVCPDNIVVSPGMSGSGMVHVQHPDLGRVRQRSIISNRFLIDNELDSLRYFSPEQCDGEDPCVQSDVYALGLVLYEMIAGVPPFDAPTAVALIHQHKNQPPPDIRIENFNLRMLVTHALTEALQKQARLRQSSANTFARQLRHIEQLATHTSTPPPAGTVSHIPPAAITPVLPSTAAPIRKVHPTEVAPSMPLVAADVDLPRPEPTVAPEIIEEAEVIRNEAVPVETPVAASTSKVRGRRVSVEEALEESYATLTNLAAPPPHRPSLLQAWKEKLHAVTSLLSFERVEAHEATGDRVIQLDDSIDEQSPTRVAKKIEWVQPDDDLPSMDDVQEVLARDQEMPLPISAVEAEPEPILASVAEPEVDLAPRAATKIEWFEEDDIPSMDDVQEVLARGEEMPLAEPEPVSIEEPQVLAIESEPEVIEVEAAQSEAQEILVEPEHREPEVIHVETVVSEPQELVVEPPQPEPEVIHVEPAISETQELVIEPPQPEPDVIHVESAVSEQQERVVEPPQPEPEVIHVESAVSETQELVVETPQAEQEVIHVERAQPEPQELVVEPPSSEPEVIHVESAVSEQQELVVEPPRSEPEVIHVESALSRELVAEPPVLSEAEPVAPAPEIIAAPASRSDSPKVLRGIRRSAAAVIRKRHKKFLRKHPVALFVEPELIQVEPAFFEPQELVVEPPQPEPEVVHVASEPQELVVEHPQPEPEVVHAASEPQELVVEPPQPEPEVIQVEAVSEPQDLVVEPPQPEPEVIQVEAVQSEPQELVVEPPQPEPEVVHAASKPQELIVEPSQPEPEAIQAEPALSEPQEISVEPLQPETELICVESEVSEPQELVVEPSQPEPEVIHAEPVTPAPEPIAAEALPTEPATLAPVVAQFAVVTRRRKKSSQRQQPVVITKPVSSDDEEITVVRARSKRVRIHVDPQTRPRRSQPAIRRRSPVPAEIAFVPTLLGRTVEPTAFMSDENDTMFAAYSTESSGPISRHRSHVIGGGIIALLALVLFGADSITRFVQTWSSADSMTADAGRRAETKPVVPTTAARPIISQPLLDKPVIDKPVADKTVADKKDRTATRGKASVAADTGTSIPHESLTRIMIPLPSRSASAGTRLATDNAVLKRNSDRTTVPKTGPLTRPRVVQEPEK